MAARIQAYDWETTPLGPTGLWPQSLRTVVDLMLTSSSMMSLVWGAEAIHLYNDSFTELLREHRTEALGKSAFETFARSRDVFTADVAAGMSGKSARLLAQRYPVLRNGQLEEAWFDVDYAPVRDETGTVAGVLWTLKEITAQVQAERALRESEARHRLLLHSWIQAVWEADANGVVIADSQSWRAYTGQTLEEWLGYGWLGAVHPDERAYAERQWRETIAVGGLVDGEFRLRAPDGGWRWTNVRAAPVLDASGRIEKWAGMNIDIDVRKRAEMMLKEAEARQSFLLMLSDALRPIGDPIEIQRAATRMLGEHLEASRVFYVVVENDGDTAAILGDYTDGIPSRVGRYSLSAFSSSALSEWQSGQIASTDDVNTDPRYSQAEREAYASVSTRAGFGVPLIKAGRLVALLGVNQSSPRRWTDYDTNLSGDVAERTWAALERARAEAALRASEELRRIALNGGSMGAWRWDLGDRLIWGDARFLSLWGHPPSDAPHPLALFIDRMSPDGATELEVIVAHAIKADEEFDGQLQIVSGPTAGTWIRWRGRADGPGSRILHGITFDITEHRRAATALRESEERFRAFAENSADTIWIANGGATRLEYLSPAFERMFGEPRDSVLANIHRWAELVHPDDREGAQQAMPHALAGEVAVIHYRVVRPSDGSVVHVRDTGFPIHDEKGAVVRVAGIVQDVTDITRASEALEAEKERFQTLAEGISPLVWRASDEGLWTWVSPQWCNYTGQSDQESLGWGWLAAIHPDDREQAVAAWQEARPHGQLDVEYRVRRTVDRSWRWHQTRSLPVRNGPTMAQPDGRILEWLGTTTDIDDLKRLQGQQQVLVAELQHRTRNLLAVVRNVARRSIAPSPGRDDYDARLSALGRVQGFLSRSTAYAVPLADVVQAELLAVGDGATGKVVVGGPAVELPGESVQVVALALHELATNAVKHGAIAQPSGQLSVLWRLEEHSDGRHLVIDWRESGVVMPDGPPSRRGYGSELITRALPYQLSAETELEFTPDGVRCQVILPKSAFTDPLKEDVL